MHNVPCSKCHRKNAPWRSFCGACGSALAGACATCNTVNAATDRYCGGCAHPLAKKAGPPLAPPRRSKYSTRFPSVNSTVQIARVDIVDEKFTG
jgi:Double zinc ribbon